MLWEEGREEEGSSHVSSSVSFSRTTSSFLPFFRLLQLELGDRVIHKSLSRSRLSISFLSRRGVSFKKEQGSIMLTALLPSLPCLLPPPFFFQISNVGESFDGDTVFFIEIISILLQDSLSTRFLPKLKIRRRVFPGPRNNVSTCRLNEGADVSL